MAESETKKGGGLFAGLAGATAVALLSGAAAGLTIGMPAKPPASQQPAEPTQKVVDLPDNVRLRTLDPVLTNLSDPASAYIRIEASILVDADTESVATLAASIGDDFVTYLRTVPLSDLEGPTGFQLLKEDLADRARIRAGGKVRDIYFNAVVVE